MQNVNFQIRWRDWVSQLGLKTKQTKPPVNTIFGSWEGGKYMHLPVVKCMYYMHIHD